MSQTLGEMLRQSQSDVSIFSGIGPSLLNVYLVKGKLFCTLARYVGHI